MDEAVIKYYRRLLRTGFEHSGSLENATIFLDSVTEQLVHCGSIGNYVEVYIKVTENRVDDIKYICSCDPAANVALEIMCALVKGKTLKEITTITDEAFFRFLGCECEELGKRAKNLLELLNKGISRYLLRT